MTNAYEVTMRKASKKQRKEKQRKWKIETIIMYARMKKLKASMSSS